jgi:DNA polymerase
MSSILSDIKQFLSQERQLFGDSMIVEPPRNSAAAEPRHNPLKTPEPELFSLPPAGPGTLTDEPWGQATSLADLDSAICTCVKCSLGHTRIKFVFGVGNPHATLMLVGEAPGADEDARGEPFVGRAGQLLNKILAAINFRREDVYICNILKCRPPNNRQPLPEEVDSCLPYLKKQIDLVKPKLILCLGLTAAHNILQTTESLTHLRGRVLSYENVPLMVTYHPAALLRNPNFKQPTWQDVQAARKLHDELVAQG